ncbi:MAG: trypsin-like peptidase domain-containing protein [Patescibacteria group bacterium]
MKIRYALFVVFFAIQFFLFEDARAEITQKEAVQRCFRAVVKIESVKIGESSESSSGSGFFISPTDVLTAAHVVGDIPKTADEFRTVYADVDLKRRNIFVVKEGKRYRAKVLWRDPSIDVAVIRLVEPILGSAPLIIGDSNAVTVGDRVVACGHVFGLQYQTVTGGHITAIRQFNGLASYEDYFQTDATINSGNSGGPLLSLETGENIGIVNSTVGGDNNGFAIPSNIFTSVSASNPKGTLRRSWLGIKFPIEELVLSDDFQGQFFLYKILGKENKILRGIQTELVSSLKGVLITDLIATLEEPYFDALHENAKNMLVASFSDLQSPARRAGLMAGDIIRRFDGKVIKTSRDFLYALFMSEPYKAISIHVIRVREDGTSEELDLIATPIVRIPESVRKDSY